MDLFAPIEPRHPGREGDYVDLGPPPERVYARLDRFDADALGGGRAAYDCVDADWFDAAAPEVGWLGEAAVGEELGERISIVPTLYFDVGGGTTANARTYPATMRRFCVSADPPVVLSHWDWDHWSSALRDRRLLDRRWIVPRHDGQLGAVHTRLLGELHQRGRLLVWPRGLPSAAGDGILVEQCAGSPSDRNNSGLALVIAGRTNDEGARMLFPGDAAYGHVPSAGGELTSLAVPHHGGRTPSSQVPRPDGARPGRAVFSYGAGNCYWHPLADVGREHQRDWKRRLHTAARDRRGLGHVHLYWNEADPDAEPPCGGAACDLGCHLR